MDTVFFGTNRLVLVKTTQGQYWAAMLGSVVVGASCAGKKIEPVWTWCRYGAGMVPTQEAPTTTDPNIAANYRSWVALTKTNRLVPKKTVIMANFAQKTAFLEFWPNFHGQYLSEYRSKSYKSYRFGISIKFWVKWIQKSISLWNF